MVNVLEWGRSLINFNKPKQDSLEEVKGIFLLKSKLGWVDNGITSEQLNKMKIRIEEEGYLGSTWLSGLLISALLNSMG